MAKKRWLDEFDGRITPANVSPPASPKVNIPKEGANRSRHAPVRIPCIRDRVVQMAAVLVLGPIFEADLEPEQYAYRPEQTPRMP